MGREAHTAGPWAWMGNQHGLYLATTHSGRKYVMGFRRMGTQGAQPVFRINERLVPASDLVEFEVGDGEARGFAEGRADETVYRYDVSAIDAADARLIAAAPDLLEALLLHDAYEALPADRGGANGPKGKAGIAWLNAKRAALQRATGAE